MRGLPLDINYENPLMKKNEVFYRYSLRPFQRAPTTPLSQDKAVRLRCLTRLLGFPRGDDLSGRLFFTPASPPLFIFRVSPEPQSATIPA